jgi:hypothetical protein
MRSRSDGLRWVSAITQPRAGAAILLLQPVLPVECVAWSRCVGGTSMGGMVYFQEHPWVSQATFGRVHTKMEVDWWNTQAHLDKRVCGSIAACCCCSVVLARAWVCSLLRVWCPEVWAVTATDGECWPFHTYPPAAPGAPVTQPLLLLNLARSVC